MLLLSKLCSTIPLLLSSIPLLISATGSSLDEYQSLGCPSSTRPYASKNQQLKAITDFADQLYIQKAVAKAENTYVAEHYINHAPEISGDGRAVAIAALTPRLNTSIIEFQRIFVGRDVNGVSYATIHFKGNSQSLGVGAIAAIWRMIGTCLVEYWDVATGVKNSSNPKAYF